MTPAPSIVCLDAAGTLFTERIGRAALYSEVFGSFGVSVPPGQMEDWMAEAHAALPAVVDGAVRYSDTWFRAFVAHLLQRADSPRDPEPLRAALADAFTRPDSYVVYADTFPALEDLVAAGTRLALVSNWSDRLEGLLLALDLVRYFEVLAISAVVGHDKPHPGIFRHALERMGAKPENALHVGDDPLRDVQGARRAGLDALLIDRSGAAGGGGPADADVIGSLLDLPSRLAATRWE